VDTPVEIVVFSVQSRLFGAYAGQVEEVFCAEAIHEDGDDGFLSFLYRGNESRGIDFAFWLTQQDFRDHQHCWQNNERKRSVGATLLIMKQAGHEYRGVRIDTVEEFISCSLNHIHTLPVSMQRVCRTPALWGIARKGDYLIPLIDLSRLVLSDKGEITT
jgi:chemotaxis signal transduction protein